MVFREVSVIEVREALRAWLAGKSERAVAAQAGVDRKTSRRYVRAAAAAGLSREGGEEQLTDELIGQVWTPTGFVDTIRSGTMVYEERTGSGTGSQEVHPGI